MSSSHLGTLPDEAWEKILNNLRSVRHFGRVCKQARDILLRVTSTIRLEFVPAELDKALRIIHKLDTIQHVTIKIVPPEKQDTEKECKNVDLSALSKLLGEKGKQLRSLHIRRGYALVKWVVPWHAFSRLETLDINCKSLAIQTADEMNWLTNLRKLTLHTEFPIDAICERKHLTHLSMYVLEKGRTDISGLGALHSLQTLLLYGAFETSGFSGVKSLSSLASLTALTRLELDNFKALDSLAFLTSLVGLRRLTCNNFGVSQAPVFTFNTGLEYLDLYHFNSRNMQVSTLACLTNLTMLDLSHTFMHRSQVDITPLTALTVLKIFNIQHTPSLMAPAVKAFVATMPQLDLLDMLYSGDAVKHSVGCSWSKNGVPVA